jgi:CubicO group peptidase (beta-lactamase class C family)
VVSTDRRVGGILVTAIILMAGPALVDARAQAPRPKVDWEVVDPKTSGLDIEVIEAYRVLRERSRADACLVAHKGKIILEWYGPNYKLPITTMSSMKSWTGLLVGMLIADGKIKDVDQPVSDFLPEWGEGEKAKVTLRHLLTMTSGLKQRKGREPGPDQSVGFVGDKNAFVIGLPLSEAPGKTWSYSNEGVQLLSPILEKAAGVPLQDYAQTRLFEPLGMTMTRLKLDQKGHPWTYADAETSLRDFAKIGQLMLQGGKWGGRQIVPESWVSDSTQACPQYPFYGYLWWLKIDGSKGFATRGYRDTDCYVLPEQSLVVARMQNNQPADGAAPYSIKEAATMFRNMVKKK